MDGPHSCADGCQQLLTVKRLNRLGGISRMSFQMNAASLPHLKLMEAIETIGANVAPLLRDA
jgi:hypothetical protein